MISSTKVFNFTTRKLDYIQRKFPINDPVICNSRWVDVLQRDKEEWNEVDFMYYLLRELRNKVRPQKISKFKEV